MATRKSRLIPPLNLIAAMVLCFLPWVEVRCDYTSQHASGSLMVVSQSGFKAATGTYSKRARNAPIRPPDPNQTALQRTPEPMPLLLLYALLLVAGAVVGWVLKTGHLRSLLLVLCPSAASMVLFLQAQRGCSIEASLPVENAELKKQFDSRREASRLTEEQP
jgi:hypothetical protein